MNGIMTKRPGKPGMTCDWRWTKYGIPLEPADMSHRAVIEVREEGSTKGAIYQVGNYNDDLWLLHGTTMGFA